MKKYLFPLSLIFTAVILGCREEEILRQEPNTPISINGYVQKGPFINGTAITLSKLNDKLVPTGKNFTTQIADNRGSFSLKDIDLESEFVQLQADGFYFDEVKGEKSAAQLTLFALANVSDTSSVNINLLSHLERNRVVYLTQENKQEFEKAKKQAQQEILTAFGIASDSIGYSEQLDLSQDGDQNAILLAISAILQGNNSVADLSELLGNMITDLREDGTMNSEAIKTKLEEQAKALNLPQIRKNLEERYAAMGVEATIPNFEQYIDSDGDGILNKDEDDTPEDFSFETQIDVAVNDTITSNVITISGLKGGGIAVASVTNGWLVMNSSVVNQKTADASIARLKNGDELQIQLVSSSEFADTTTATITIGTLSRSFSIVTDNYLPGANSFSPLTDVAVDSLYTSDTITISGLPHPTSTSIINGILIKNDEVISSDSVTVKNGDQLAIQLRSSPEIETTVSASLKINGVTGGFAVTTDDYSPDPFTFKSIENAKRNTVYRSDTITIAGLPHPAPQNMAWFNTDDYNTSAIYINGEKHTDYGSSLYIKDGDQIWIEGTSWGQYSNTKTYSLVINDIKSEFSITTETSPWQRKTDFPVQEKTYVNFSIKEKIYVGVYDPEYGGYVKDLYVFSPSSNQWASVANVPESTTYHHFTAVVDNKAYCLMNSGFWEYNPSINQWIQKTTISNAELIEFDCKLIGINNKVYLINRLGEVWIYTPSTDTWQQDNDIPFEYSFSATSFTLENSIYIVHPNDPDEPYPNNPSTPIQSHVWEYNTINKIWTQKNNLSLASVDGSSFVTQNRAYFLPGTWHAEYAVYDQANDEWEILDPKPGDYLQGISSNKKGYAIEWGKLYEFTPPQE